MTDKIVILAGGISSRMKKPVDDYLNLDEKLIKDADEKAKSMIRLGEGERPFLDYLLHNICEASFKDVLIIIGQNDNSLKNYYTKNNLFTKLNLIFATQFIPNGYSKPIGTSDALLQGLNTVKDWKGNSFLVVNSDNLYSVEALKTLRESEYPNALIDYDREGFQFEKERVNAFAILEKDREGFLTDIIEKPSENIVNNFLLKFGEIRVSMNIFKLYFDMIYPFLEKCPTDPTKNEKYLPVAVKMMINEYPKSMFCYPFKEHVPDLTSKQDIITVKEYLEKHFNGKLK